MVTIPSSGKSSSPSDYRAAERAAQINAIERYVTTTARQRATLASVYVALTTDSVLELMGVEGDLIIDDPLAENGLYAEVLSCARTRAAILLSHGCAPAALPAALLCNIDPVEQRYTRVKSHADYKRLLVCRSVWQEAATYCAGYSFSQPATQ